MARNFAIIIFLSLAMGLQGQTPVGSWSDHLMYSSARNVAVGEKDIYASTGSSLLIYSREYAELRKMSEINGLSETGISTISWSDDQKALIIAYNNCNIDILLNNTVSNIPDVERKYIPGLKTINRIRCRGKYAYLASSFGIVVLDLIKKEIFDTWKPGASSDAPAVYDIAFSDVNIYAATSAGVYSAALSDPGLAYFGNWNRLNNLPVPAGKYNHAIWSGGKLYVNFNDSQSGGDIVYQAATAATLFSYLPGIFNMSFDAANDGFFISSATIARQFDKAGSLIRTIDSYGWGSPEISQALVSGTDTWIADAGKGLIKGSGMTGFKLLSLPGPASNSGYSINSQGGKTVICAGAVDAAWNNLWNPLKVSVFDASQWTAITSSSIHDPMRSLIDSKDRDHIYITTWGNGLLEYRDNVLVKQYNEYNSPLQSIIPGKPFTRVCGIASDVKGNVWLTQTQVPGSIKVLKPDGGWIVIPVTIDAPTIGDIIITSRGHKWIVLPRGYGLFIYDDNGTLETYGDDRARKMLVKDTDNQVVSNVLSVAEDAEGAIWVGTDQGPFVYYNPGDVFDKELKAVRPKVPRNDGTDIYDYLLKSETITSIKVDGANRKWLGTFNSGAFLVSPDGSSLIHSFDDRNSPLFSSSITSLSVDDKTGDVWFGTSEGIESYRGIATSGSESFESVYTFPNPVREDWEGNVTITGLMRDTQIRITDVSGNLVYRTVSKGGQAEWDLRTYNGKRVATGVYIVFCASVDGSQSAVTKMLVIN